MEFVLVHKDRVLLGPISWRKRAFEQDLKDELGIETILPAVNTDGRPITIDEDTRILYFAGVQQTIPIDELLDEPAGPYYIFYENYCTSYYNPVPRNINSVKGIVKSRVPGARYSKETGGVIVSVNTSEYLVSTLREERNLFSSGIAGLWKMKKVNRITINEKEQIFISDDWVNLTSENLTTIDNAIKQHVSDSFAWENAKYAAIDALNTLQECKDFQING